MFSTQQAQTGNRVYGGTSQAPNRGQVSAAGAQGYIKRELRNKKRAGVQRRIGGDGQSDNRSAVAAQALKRTQQTKKVIFNNEGRPITTHTDTTHTDNTPPPPAPPPPTQVQVSADGILQLPYDQSFGTEQLAAINDANDKLLGLKVEGDQHAMQYGQGRRDIDSAYSSLKNQTLNENAASGTAFSSRYGTAVANNAGQYANQLGDLELENANFNQNRSFQTSAIQSSLNQQLAALAQQYADSLNDQAGTLGYGQNQQPIPPPNNAGNTKPDPKAGKLPPRIPKHPAQHPPRHRNKHKKGGTKK